MSFDQIIQIVNTVGIWLAAFATVAAVVVSLYLSNRSEKVKLRVTIGIRIMLEGRPLSNRGEHVWVGITNRGRRDAVVSSIGWSIGKGKSKEYCLIREWSVGSSNIPVRLPHGDSANFLISLKEVDWINDFAKKFCKQHSIKTLRCLIGTSVGDEVKVIPDGSFLDRLGKATMSADNNSV